MEATLWPDGRRPDDWEARFAQGLCSGFGELAESPRFALIAGYIHRLLPAASVLDVGCGEGHLAGYLDPGRVSYRGLDPSPTAVANARARFPSRRFELSAAEDYPLPEDVSYDAIVFNEVLPHLIAPIDTVRRYQQRLTSRGIVIVSLFQNLHPLSNGRIFAAAFENEVAAHRFTVRAEADVTSRPENLRWRVIVLG